jgi:hypothetical protein
VLAGVRFDRVNHGVDTGRGGGGGRQSERQRGVQDRHVRIQLGRDDARFARLTGRDDGDVGDFGTCAGGAWNLDQRQAFPPDLPYSVGFL